MKNAFLKIVKTGPGWTERAPRHSVDISARVSLFRWLPMFGSDVQVLNLSESGVKLQFDRLLKAKPGETFWLKFLDLNIPGGPAQISVKAECRWCHAKHKTMGARLDFPDEESRRMIRLLIEHVAKQH